VQVSPGFDSVFVEGVFGQFEGALSEVEARVGLLHRDFVPLRFVFLAEFQDGGQDIVAFLKSFSVDCQAVADLAFDGVSTAVQLRTDALDHDRRP